MRGLILTLNAGSSSLKYGLFKADAAGLVQIAHGQNSLTPDAPLDENAWVAQMLAWVAQQAPDLPLLAVGHRVVHGGRSYAAPVLVNAEVIAELTTLIPLAPLHQPHNLAAIQTLLSVQPTLPQIACFDTAFHRGHSEVVDHFALPQRYTAAGVQRYGFHGISYEYIASRLPQIAPELASGKVIVAHLGNGSSLCALQTGRSVDSTMGFSTLDGLPMGTRCGSIDAGVLLYLLQHEAMSVATLEHLLYHDSGLLGVSGLSADMRVLAASATAGAKEAIALYVFQIARQIGALSMTLGGLDALIFTAGIGEHSAEVRAAVGERLHWMGLRLNTAANQQHELRISDNDSRISAWVIPTDEEAMIARHSLDLLQQGAST